MPETAGPFTFHARSHPEAIARDRAHQRARRCPAKATGGDPCTCQPDPADLDDVWAGRARMARARQAAGQPLDTVDHQALTRQETT